ncbi:MAG TPA: M1 family aminopeptidase [Gaiellaceae bacterium]|nr:M1 family aminopeptidase [Gaiellaceae bacterium]
MYDRMPDELTVEHELSHMWFGDAVTLTQWPDIWLHEGFATFSEWIWSEYTGNKTAQSTSTTSTTSRPRT